VIVCAKKAIASRDTKTGRKISAYPFQGELSGRGENASTGLGKAVADKAQNFPCLRRIAILGVRGKPAGAVLCPARQREGGNHRWNQALRQQPETTPLHVLSGDFRSGTF
jgi:hypothetical protein